MAAFYYGVNPCLQFVTTVLLIDACTNLYYTTPPTHNHHHHIHHSPVEGGPQVTPADAKVMSPPNLLMLSR